METRFNSDERKRIQEGINEKYKRVAISPEGNFNYPTGRAGLEGQKYNPDVLRKLPKDVLASYCGVGNPFSLGPINKDEAVLDIGCGASVDTLHQGGIADISSFSGENLGSEGNFSEI